MEVTILPDANLETVTPVANPSEPVDGTVIAPDGGQTEAPPDVSNQQTTQPDEAYKGMQRALEREKTRTRELEARLQQEVATPRDNNSAQIVNGLLGEIAKTDPNRAQALAAAYQQYRLAAENEVLRNQQTTQDQIRLINEAQERNMQELRATATAFGVNPDSHLIDYGDPDNDSLAERLAKVRSSAIAAAKPVETPVAAPRQEHNTQAGAPPTPPAGANAAVSAEQLMAAQANYARAYQGMNPDERAKADASLRDLTNRFAAQELA